MRIRIITEVDLDDRDDVRDKAIETKQLWELLKKRWDRLYEQLLKEGEP